MHTRLTPTKTARGNLAEDRGTGRVTVLFQAGEMAVDDNGYSVLDSVQDLADLPEESVGSEGFLTRLDLIVAERYPGRELIDWVILDPDYF
jgi:hypothetical protein